MINLCDAQSVDHREHKLNIQAWMQKWLHSSSASTPQQKKCDWASRSAAGVTRSFSSLSGILGHSYHSAGFLGATARRSGAWAPGFRGICAQPGNGPARSTHQSSRGFVLFLLSYPSFTSNFRCCCDWNNWWMIWSHFQKTWSSLSFWFSTQAVICKKLP